ncbi:EamA family transporter [Chryseolinea sp. H1M3-3]|uniref:EamA family transporter n=1 Tax=Chryseolinea sp. H1M3-3 TaxID=3034144 RepID=UPI0023EC6977|nr:EamA family transporter [Chryseolinea sp. H1M3-3]
MKKDLLIPYIALGAICLIWGTTYLVLRIAVLHFPPLLFVTIRQIIAGALLIGFMLLSRKVVWPNLAHIKRQAIAGFFMISLGNGLVAWAEVLIPSGVAAIICSLMPVMVILINLGINGSERPTAAILIGVSLGLAGIIMIFKEHLAQFSQLEYQIGIFAIFIAVISWAGGSVWLKRRGNDGNAFMNAGLQMFFGGVWLIPGALLFEDLSRVTWSAEALYSLIYLVLIGSIVAYACYSYVLRKLPMTIVSLYAYVNPIVAVLLGWIVLNEKLNIQIGIAILVTVTGIYIVNLGYQIGRLWKQQFSR